jgi:hypothetical protein
MDLSQNRMAGRARLSIGLSTGECWRPTPEQGPEFHRLAILIPYGLYRIKMGVNINSP